jgi:uncharacterized protein (TIGR01777 family)
MCEANLSTILITGASGLVGRRLTKLLLQRGYTVHTLSRSRKKNSKQVKNFVWSVREKKIDSAAFEGVGAIVHLAGAGVADEKWTPQRKAEILESRTLSTQLLFHTLQSVYHSVECIVSASAVGFYGDRGANTLDENAPAADTFLANVCQKWEEEIKKFSTIGIREVRLRIGIVLAKEGGALPELSKSIPFGVAGYFNKKPLYYPWIHIDDVCGIFIHAIENKNISGVYNTTAPQPVELKDLMKAIAKGMNKTALLLPVPPFAIKIAMGEMADMLLSSQNCSSDKIVRSGYRFQFTDPEKAVKSLFS